MLRVNFQPHRILLISNVFNAERIIVVFLDLVMHTKEYDTVMVVTLGYPGPVASVSQYLVERITDSFEFSDQHFVVSKIKANCQQTIIERFFLIPLTSL